MKPCVYCKSGHFRGTFIFALNLATAKIKTLEYILYMSPSMEQQKSKIANKKTSEFTLNWLTAEMTPFTVLCFVVHQTTSPLCLELLL